MSFSKLTNRCSHGCGTCRVDIVNCMGTTTIDRTGSSGAVSLTMSPLYLDVTDIQVQRAWHNAWFAVVLPCFQKVHIICQNVLYV